MGATKTPNVLLTNQEPKSTGVLNYFVTAHTLHNTTTVHYLTELLRNCHVRCGAQCESEALP